MKILISNDDGYQSEGIKILTQYLSKDHKVIVVAPSENKSAASSSLTLDKPLKPKKIDTVPWRLIFDSPQNKKVFPVGILIHIGRCW